MSDLVRILLEKLLGWAQKHLYQSPSRDWNEIDVIDRTGRIALMVIVSVVIFAPLAWLLFG